VKGRKAEWVSENTAYVRAESAALLLYRYCFIVSGMLDVDRKPSTFSRISEAILDLGDDLVIIFLALVVALGDPMRDDQQDRTPPKSS
jgi:hypothetical protein